MPNKTVAQRIHAKGMMLERYGITLNQRSYWALALTIRNFSRGETKNVKFVDRQSNRVTRWFVKHQGHWFPVVYDSKRKTVVTVLPEGALGSPPES